MAADSSSSQAAQARRLKQVVDQAAAHFGRCFGQPRKPARTQSLFLPTNPEPYSALELPDASAEVDPLPSTLTNQWRDLEEARVRSTPPQTPATQQLTAPTGNASPECQSPSPDGRS